jgi:serine/threonine protein kinase
MGVVFKARQPALNRLVALKMVLAGGRASAAQLARFRKEATAVARLDHPNIVKVYDIGERDGLPFIAMEYIEGGGLDARLKREPLPPKAAAALAEPLARAMDYAHGRGVIHRDLKPANVLLAPRPSPRASGDTASPPSTGTAPAGSARPASAVPSGPTTQFRVADWEPKVTDFGLAKQLEDDTDSLTRTGAVMGSPNYMAPEQAEGKTKEVDHRADVYGLGACLYEFITGRPPFSGASAALILSQVRSHDPVSPSRLVAELPRDLETICLKCLQKEPAKRYTTAGELADDLRRFLNGEPIRARPVSRAEKVVRWVRRKPREAALWFAAAALAVVAVVGLTVGYVRTKLLNAEIGRQKEQIERANTNLLAANVKLTTERDTAERVQGFFADECRRIYREVINRLPPTRLGKDREELADYLTKAVGRLNRLTSEGAGIAGRLRLAAKLMIGDTLMSRRLLGRIQDLDDVHAAVAAYEEAEAVATNLVQEDADSDLARGNLALLKARLAHAQLQLGDLSTARKYLDEAMALRETIVSAPKDPGAAPVRIYPADALMSLADSYLQRATWYEQAGRQSNPVVPANGAATARASDLKSVLELRKKALAKAEADPKSYDSEWIPLDRFKDALAETYLLLAADAAAANQMADAQRLLNDALKQSGRSVADAAASLPHKEAVARLLFALGVAYLKANQPAAAGDWFERMRAVAEAKLREASGASEDDQHLLYQAYYGLGTVAQLTGRRAEAIARFKECVKLADNLARDNPRPRHVWAQMIALARAGYPDRAAAVVREEQARVDDPRTGYLRVPAEFSFNAACAYALAAHAVGRWADDAKLSADEAKQRALYLDEAWGAIEQAVRLNGSQAKALDSDPDLAFLHAQPGSAQRLKQIRTKYAAK